ncbi:TrmB family transcriptional regulator [Candidatus Latescibacterota bacterium]
MDSKRIESIMTGLGFSLYEARAYSALVGENPLTGYELSGRSGIPRSKIYECIERLNRKKLILPLGGNPVRYVPLPPNDLINRLSNEFESSVKKLGSLLNEGMESDPVDYIFNIGGYDEILMKAQEIIDSAEQSIDLSLWAPEIERLEKHIGSAVKRDMKVRLLSFSGGKYSLGDVYHHRPLHEDEFSGRWITIVKDRSEVLTGQCSGESGIVAAWTRNKCLVFVSLKYIDHEIIKIREDVS